MKRILAVLAVALAATIGWGAGTLMETVIQGGPLTLNIATGTGVTLNYTNAVYNCNVDGQTVTLPTAVGVAGRTYTIRTISPANTVTLATTSSQLIDDATTFTLFPSNNWLTVISNGTNWCSVAGPSTRAYGELYVHDGVTAMVVTNAGTYYTLAPAFTAGSSLGTTLATSSNSITVLKKGMYQYNGSLSFSGTGNSTIECAAFTNGTEAINSDFKRKIGSGGDVGSAAKAAMLNLNAGDYVQMKITADSNGDSITIQQANFSLRLIQ
jgi:hypothetical protein